MDADAGRDKPEMRTSCTQSVAMAGKTKASQQHSPASRLHAQSSALWKLICSAIGLRISILPPKTNANSMRLGPLEAIFRQIYRAVSDEIFHEVPRLLLPRQKITPIEYL